MQLKLTGNVAKSGEVLNWVGFRPFPPKAFGVMSV